MDKMKQKLYKNENSEKSENWSENSPNTRLPSVLEHNEDF